MKAATDLVILFSFSELGGKVDNIYLFLAELGPPWQWHWQALVSQGENG